MKETEPRYDDVQIVNVVDGTTIEGHDAVKAYFDEGKRLVEAHGPRVIFQVYRLNMRATAIDEMQGPKLIEIRVDGDDIAGNDTVAAVKGRLLHRIAERARLRYDEGASRALRVEEADRISLWFAGCLMRDEKLFYADHPMLLPAWVQVFLHPCEVDGIMALARTLRGG